MGADHVVELYDSGLMHDKIMKAKIVRFQVWTQ
jgi:hypothetical protein